MPRQIDLNPQNLKVTNNPNNQIGYTADQIANMLAQIPEALAKALETAIQDILQEIDALTGLNLVGFAQALQELFSGNPGDLLTLLLGMITGNNGDILALIESVGGTVITDVGNVIKDAENIAATALGGVTQLSGALSTLQALLQTVATAIGNLVDSLVNFLGDGEDIVGATLSDLEGVLDNIPLIGPLVEAITGQSPTGTGASSGGSGPLGLGILSGWVTDLENLLGLGGRGTSGGGSTSTVSNNTLTLQQLLGYLGTNTQVPPNLFAALAPGTSSNVLTDPGFSNNYALSCTPFGDIQGQGLWYWDGFQGNSAPGSVRTKRTGVVTVFWLTGTYGANPITSAPTWTTTVNGPIDWSTFHEYWLDPDAESLGFYANTGEGFNQGLDHTYFEFVNVFYGAAMFPMKTTLAQGVANLVAMIKATPGPFILTGWSQGAQVISNVYDLIRYGTYNDGCNSLTDTSLMSRRSDLLAGIALGNPRRQEGWTFPGFPDPAPGTAGINSVRLSDCENLWWEICLPNDPAATVDLKSQEGQWMRLLWQTIVEQGTASGSEYEAAIEDFLTTGNWVQLIELIVDPSQISVFIQAVNDYFQLGVHDSYWDAAVTIDSRATTFGEIALEYIGKFAPFSHPPVNGVRHQLVGAPVAVQPYQVVTAGATAMWQFVVGSGPQILVAVNAYDANNNLIATVTASQATVSDPEPTSDYEWSTLSADFVMPAGTASACIVFDVEPQAMTTGIVWFTDAIFEVSTLLDGALLDVTNMQALSLAQVQGPQGTADLLTAWQNLIDAQVSASSQTNVTGAQFAQMLQSLGLTTVNASQALALGVASQQVLSNASTQPLWSGMQPTGQVTFPLPAGDLPFVSVASGTSLMGFINTNPALSVGFVEFMAKGTGGSGVYVNAYGLDQSTGNLTNLWSSEDVSSQVPNGEYGWVGIDIASADQPNLSLGQWVCWEIVAESTTIDVVAQVYSTPTKTYSVAAPSNMGAARTTSSTGGVSPSSLTSSQVSYGGTLPFVCMSISDLPPTYMPPNQQDWQNNGTYIYTIPDWVQPGDYIDVVLLGAGAGGGDQIPGVNLELDLIIVVFEIPESQPVNGQGGQPGQWTTTTLVYGTDIPDSTTTLTLTVGLGGAAGVGGTPGAGGNSGWGINGGNTTLSGTGVTTITAAGGAAGGYGGNNPANPTVGTVGAGPGNKIFEGRTYFGGATVSTTSFPGSPPGGAGVGGVGGAPGPGADGAAWITARQSGSTIATGVGGMGGGMGGSELSVAYEATGTGNDNVDSSTLSWTHESDGGPNCAVVLLGAVQYYNGSVSISASYGSASFVYVLDDITYDFGYEHPILETDPYGFIIFALGLFNPPNGTQTVTITASGTATMQQLSGNTISYQNVGSFGNFYTNSGSGTSLSLTGLSPATGQMAVGGFAGVSYAQSTFNQTSRWNQPNTVSLPMVIGDVAGSGSAVTFSASTAGTDTWGAVGGILIPVS
jgi:hypothetical protein